MSEFKEYKPMEIEHNVKAAVENLRKAYWSNETKKVAKDYTEAEDIIISAICHHHYTVCKETTEGDLISREALKDITYINKGNFNTVEGIREWIDNAQAVESERPQGKWELHGMIYYCSECGHDCGESGDNFCGNCGAEMRGGAE